MIILSFSFPNNINLVNFPQKANAQTNNFNSINYNTFNDFTHGISIKYPSNWIKNETQNGVSFVAFDSPEVDSNNFYNAQVYLKIDDHPSSFNLDAYLQNTISGYKSNSSLFKKFKVLESGTKYFLGGYPAYKLIALYIDPDTGVKSDLIETGVIVGSSVYYIFVLVNADQYSTYLPIINNMINSFQVNNTTNTTPSSTFPSSTFPSSTTQSSQIPLVTNSMVPYTNAINGASIQYPSNWIKNETQDGASFVKFLSSGIDSKNFYIAMITLHKDDRPSTLNLDNYFQNKISFFRTNPLFENLQIVESGTNYNLAGQPAYKIIGKFINSQTGNNQEFIETGVIVGSSVYYISVLVDADQYSTYLPIINNMINSFQVNNTANTTPSSTTQSSQIPLVTNSMVPYTNAINGASIQYPSNWIKNETQDGSIFVKFSSPEINSKNFYIATIYLYADSTPSSLNLDSYLQNTIASYKNSSMFQNLQVTESGTNYNLAGQPAYKLVGTFTDMDSGIRYNIIETGIVVGSTVYYIYSVIDADQYSTYLPIINNMINSFQVNNNNNISSTTPIGTYQTPTSTIPVGTITPSGQNGLNLYENPNLNIKLTYPDKWNVSEFNNTFAIYPQKTDNIVPGLKPFFMVTTFDASGVGSADNALVSYLHYVAIQKTNFTPIQSTTLKISKDNINAQMAIYTYDDSRYGKVKEMAVFAIKGNSGYTFVFNTDEYNYSIYLPIILNMLNSLELTGSTIGSNTIQGQQPTHLPLDSSRVG